MRPWFTLAIMSCRLRFVISELKWFTTRVFERIFSACSSYAAVSRRTSVFLSPLVLLPSFFSSDSTSSDAIRCGLPTRNAFFVFFAAALFVAASLSK